MALQNLHHIAIRCQPGKLKESEEFYGKILGMGRAERPKGRGS